MNVQSAVKSYSNVHVESGIQDASPHRLVEMLFEGFLSRIAQAKGLMQQNNYEQKGKKINEAFDILSGLRDSLDLEKGGDIANNLDSLYAYAQRTLLQANSKNDPAILDECGTLIATIATSWKEIG